MSDLETALKLEKLRRQELFERLTKQEGERVLKIGMGDGSRTASGRSVDAMESARRSKWEAVVDGYIEIRRQLAVDFPEMSEPVVLDSLREEMIAAIDRAFHVPPSDGPFPVPADSVPLERRYNNKELKERVHSKVEILKHEFALKLHKPKMQSISVNTAGGPVIVNLGEIRGDVQQVVGTLNAAGQTELASILDRLASGIEALTELGSERSVFLDQVRFIARQAVGPEQNRQASVVRAVFESLRGRLQDCGNLAQVLALAGPALARHFGIHWPF